MNSTTTLSRKRLCWDDNAIRICLFNFVHCIWYYWFFSISIKSRFFNGQSNRVGIYNWFRAFLKIIKLSHAFTHTYIIYLIPNLPLIPLLFYLSFFSSKFHMCLLFHLWSKFCFNISHIYWIILFQDYLSNLFQISLFILRYFVCLTFI